MEPLRLREPATDEEIRWIAEKYEEIGKMSIRGYARTDARLVQVIGQIRIWLRDADSRVVVAQGVAPNGPMPVGMLICHLRSSSLDGLPECFIDAVYVEAAARRQGIGRRLMAEAARWGRSRGAKRTKTFVASDNREMLDLCKTAGYDVSFVELELREE